MWAGAYCGEWSVMDRRTPLRFCTQRNKPSNVHVCVLRYCRLGWSKKPRQRTPVPLLNCWSRTAHDDGAAMRTAACGYALPTMDGGCNQLPLAQGTRPHGCDTLRSNGIHSFVAHGTRPHGCDTLRIRDFLKIFRDANFSIYFLKKV